MKKKILAIASKGGHWVQLLRLNPVFEHYDVYFVSTEQAYQEQCEEGKFLLVTDASRWDKLKLIKLFFELLTIVVRRRPQVVLTTGAAPGLFGVFWGWVFGARTIWIDSIANIPKLSMSGRLAAPFCDIHLTQWPELADGKRTRFRGSVL